MADGVEERRASSPSPRDHGLQVPASSYFPAYPNGEIHMVPVTYPTLVTGFSLQNQEQNRGAGLYAVPVSSYMGPMRGVPPSTLIPLTYSIPTGPSAEAGATVDRGQGGQPQQQQQQQQQQPPPAPQQQVVRRFQIAFQLDFLLILKLAAVIFLFNQDGSRQRLVVLVFFASIIYLYQTGALTPLVRWLSQSMRRAAAPPRLPRRAVRAENVPAAPRQNDNFGLAGICSIF